MVDAYNIKNVKKSHSLIFKSKIMVQKGITRWRLIRQKIVGLHLSYCTMAKNTELYLRALTLLELGEGTLCLSCRKFLFSPISE